MNKLYANRHNEVTNSDNTAVSLVQQLIERRMKTQEQSKQIVEYYKNGQLKDYR